jgi:uncharacterized protein YjbI with pentapeptide repeats
MSRPCAYKDCKIPIWDAKHCIFHAPTINKINQVEGVNEEMFNLIEKEKNRPVKDNEKRIFNFRGFIFPGEISFKNREFNGDVDFSGAQFYSNVYFSDARFSGHADFSYAKFSGSIRFENNTFKGDEVDFSHAVMQGNAIFKFREPKFIKCVKATKVIFENTIFRQYNTYFEKIQAPDAITQDNILKCPVFIFRYCDLTNVHFSNCGLSIFSFFKSSFESARYVMCDWARKRKWWILFRRNIIFEELFFEKCKTINDNEKIMEDYQLEDLRRYREICHLYRRMKVAQDSAKDYPDASLFYYNEWEMRRESAKIKKEEKMNCVMRLGRLVLYKLYQIFAGYGDRPHWSFIWFVISFIVFTKLNIYFGFKTSDNITIDYSPDFGKSILFTLHRLMPYSLYSFNQDKYITLNFWGDINAIVSTVTLYIFIIFIGIGLKRHFRRF